MSRRVMSQCVASRTQSCSVLVVIEAPRAAIAAVHGRRFSEAARLRSTGSPVLDDSVPLVVVEELREAQPEMALSHRNYSVEALFLYGYTAFVRSMREECLNRVIALGERHLRR